MAVKVFQINMTLACEETGKNKTNTNVLKSTINSLLNIGNSSIVISSSLTPVIAKSDVDMFLFSKISFKFYDSEVIILSKEEKFPTGETVTTKTLESKLKDAVPCLCDKKTGENYNLSTLKIKVKKL